MHQVWERGTWHQPRDMLGTSPAHGQGKGELPSLLVNGKRERGRRGEGEREGEEERLELGEMSTVPMGSLSEEN